MYLLYLQTNHLLTQWPKKLKYDKLSIKWHTRNFNYRALQKRIVTLESGINRDPFFTLGKELEQADQNTDKNTPGRP